MDIKMISLNELMTDPKRILNECCDSGEILVVDLPEHGLISIQPLETTEDDSIVDDLLKNNASFRSLVEKSSMSPKKAFLTEPAS